MSSFWDCIGQFFDALNVKGFKIYQDGMAANGTDGLRIIREGISQGSNLFNLCLVFFPFEITLLFVKKYDSVGLLMLKLGIVYTRWQNVDKDLLYIFV